MTMAKQETEQLQITTDAGPVTSTKFTENQDQKKEERKRPLSKKLMRKKSPSLTPQDQVPKLMRHGANKRQSSTIFGPDRNFRSVTQSTSKDSFIGR